MMHPSGLGPGRRNMAVLMVSGLLLVPLCWYFLEGLDPSPNTKPACRGRPGGTEAYYSREETILSDPPLLLFNLSSLLTLASHAPDANASPKHSSPYLVSSMPPNPASLSSPPPSRSTHLNSQSTTPPACTVVLSRTNRFSLYPNGPSAVAEGAPSRA